LFKRLLIANRGEIALRVMRSCQELGIETVAVYSEADRDCLHVRLADFAVCIGPPAAAESYLSIPRILAAAEITGSEAIHPGYGFLAESPQFAEVCESCDIKFVGPDSEMIRKMGDKDQARALMKAAGVPVVPGSDSAVGSERELSEIASEIGFPVMIKAAAGGGGKGMRVAAGEEELSAAFNMARAEAEAAFGDSRVYVEKLIPKARHVEVQILGDDFGNLVHLYERECSLQRKHQKLMEESPCPIMMPELRKRMTDSALAGARAIGYRSAGTVEFLLDEHGEYYFMEMNTRIQVEHPVTEMLLGVDLMKEQIRIAAGERVSFRQEDLHPRGHAIECRINAEDPMRDFLPSPGRIEYLHFPGGPGIRVDSHVYSGYEIPSFYDSLIGKVIALGEGRVEAVRRMKRALDECLIEGVETTIPFHLSILKNPEFLSGNIHTSFIERNYTELASGVRT